MSDTIEFITMKPIDEQTRRAFFRYSVSFGGNRIVMAFKAFRFWPVKYANYHPKKLGVFYVDFTPMEWRFVNCFEWFWVQQVVKGGWSKTAKVISQGKGEF